MATPLNGTSTRTTSVFTATSARLLGQRTPRPIACGRPGARASHTAITTSTPRNTPKRNTGSAAITDCVTGAS